MVYHHHLKPAAIGALASCVQTAFSEGDEAAVGILRGAADELEGLRAVGRTPSGSDGRGLHIHPVGRHFSGGAVAGAGAVAAAAAGGAAQLDEMLDREPAEGAVTLALQERTAGRASRFTSTK